MYGPGFSQCRESVADSTGDVSSDRWARPEGDSTLTSAEEGAVRQHQQALAQARATEVTFREALEDWREHHAVKWREERQREYLEKQREEILRHKWIESEKARRDLGAQAILDWIGNYAASWRARYEEENGDLLS